MTDAQIIEIKALEICIMRLNTVIESLAEKINNINSTDNTDKFDSLPEWITLKQAVALKGGAAFNTYKSRPLLQPLKGKAESHIGGVKVWSKQTIYEWLKTTDEVLNHSQNNRASKSSVA